MAHFYNNIETQIVRSQKPLLLDFALAFEQLATNPRAQSTADKKGGKVITWSDPNQLEEYIQQLPLTLAPTPTLTTTPTPTPYPWSGTSSSCRRRPSASPPRTAGCARRTRASA